MRSRGIFFREIRSILRPAEKRPFTGLLRTDEGFSFDMGIFFRREHSMVYQDFFRGVSNVFLSCHGQETLCSSFEGTRHFFSSLMKASYRFFFIFLLSNPP